MDKATYETYKYIKGPMHQSLRHDSAHKHVAGSAEYIDDIPERRQASCTARSAWRIVPMQRSCRSIFRR